MPPRKSKSEIQKNSVVANFIKSNEQIIKLVVEMVQNFPMHLENMKTPPNREDEVPEIFRVMMAAAMAVSYQTNSDLTEIFANCAVQAATSEFQWSILKDEVERRLQIKETKEG